METENKNEFPLATIFLVYFASQTRAKINKMSICADTTKMLLLIVYLKL